MTVKSEKFKATSN